MRRQYEAHHVPIVAEMLSQSVPKAEICLRMGWRAWTLTRFISVHLRGFVPEGRQKEYDSYNVYDDGRVWSRHLTQFLKGEIDKDGYLVYGSMRQAGLEEKAHRLVLKLFDREPNPGEVSRHLDGDPSNNTIGNLAWGTEAENQQDRIKHGRHHWFDNYAIHLR